MRLCSGHLVLSTILALGLSGCDGSGSEPSEAQMKDAMLDAMNHPPGIIVSGPVKITSFKKGACDNLIPQSLRLHVHGKGRIYEYRRKHVQQRAQACVLQKTRIQASG